jgi:hypothetical protein
MKIIGQTILIQSIITLVDAVILRVDALVDDERRETRDSARALASPSDAGKGRRRRSSVGPLSLPRRLKQEKGDDCTTDKFDISLAEACENSYFDYAGNITDDRVNST